MADSTPKTFASLLANTATLVSEPRNTSRLPKGFATVLLASLANKLGAFVDVPLVDVPASDETPIILSGYTYTAVSSAIGRTAQNLGRSVRTSRIADANTGDVLGVRVHASKARTVDTPNGRIMLAGYDTPNTPAS